MFTPSLLISPRALHALLLISSLVALTAVSVACGPARGGGGSDACESDEDCDDDEFCRFKDPDDDEGECRSRDTDNNTPANNNPGNNNPKVTADCDAICDKYVECALFEPEARDACIAACEDEGTISSSFQDCLLNSTCEEILSCQQPANNNPVNNNPVNNNPVNNNPNNSQPATPYRFVMIEDESTDNLGGATPGADIDAIGVDVDGDQIIDHWASSVEDFNIGGSNNEYTDTDELLGFPDADCMVQNFTALGGTTGDNYVIVSFGDGADVTFGSGAIVQVWELGITNCPDQPTWRDDETTISVSVSNERSTFKRIGTVGPGTNAVFIP